jgi:hypothetical protein
VGEFRIVHLPSLRYLKARLVFEDAGAFVVEGARRLPVSVDGPAFEVIELRLPDAGEARVVLDDGSEEILGPDSLAADAQTGRVECAARGGRARAAFSRAAQQSLLEHVEEASGQFFLRVGGRRLPIRGET